VNEFDNGHQEPRAKVLNETRRKMLQRRYAALNVIN